MPETPPNQALEARLLQLERNLMQARKLQALGLLASGMAHDFNNALSAIGGYADLLRRRFGEKEPDIARYADIILQSCAHTAEMVDRLKLFTRKDRRKESLMDVHDLLKELQSITEFALPSRYRLTWDLGATNPWITGDPNLFQSIVLHLLVLAREVLPRGGSLTLRTTNFSHRFLPENAQPALALDLVSSDDRLQWDLLNRLIQGTAEQEERAGFIVIQEYLESQTGQLEITHIGEKTARVRMLFPLSFSKTRESVVEEENMALLQGEDPPPEGSFVLVVDDESGVRQFLCEYIQSNGTASRGVSCIADALQLLGHEENCRAVLVDQHLAEEDGLQLCEQILSLGRGIKVGLMTGYAGEMDPRVLSTRNIDLFEKPFNLDRVKTWIES
ncbi:MAG TPA: response regulator [Fibrobacteraceae bacterium]|nr:response regulator [Fibrobacteraceae bacterium]